MRENAVLNDRDEKHLYDNLHRLKDSERGKDISSWDDGGLALTWGLDALGNWTDFDTDANGDNDFGDGGDSQQNRDHNFANEIDDITIGSDELDYQHDAAGNLTLQQLSPTSRRLFTWDAWNRLVAVDYQTWGGSAWGTEQHRAEYSYYALHQRAASPVDTDQDGSYQADESSHFYYDASWRLLERRVDTAYNGWTAESWERDRIDQYVWGLRYIDELVYFHKDTDDDGQFSDGGDTRDYALTDRNFSVVGMGPGGGGNVAIERVRYQPYGQARATIRPDVSADGTVNSTDTNMVLVAIGEDIGDNGYFAEGDVDRDGEIDSTDYGIVSIGGGGIADGSISGKANIVGYCGYVFEEELSLYCVRHRWYDPKTGRWMGRDKKGFIDGSNLLAYVQGRPTKHLDPYGYKSEQEDWDDSGFQKPVDQALDFWLKWLGASERDSEGNNTGVSAACLERLKCIIRAMSWVESKHGKGIGNHPDRDPMQVGNPDDDAHKSITGKKKQGGPKRRGELPGVPIYPDLPERIRNPRDDDGNVDAPSPFSDPEYVYPAEGHDSEAFDPDDSFFWGVIWYLTRTNQSDDTASPRGAWNLADCSWKRLIDGAVRYNGKGDEDYREKIESALSDSGCCKEGQE